MTNIRCGSPSWFPPSAAQWGDCPFHKQPALLPPPLLLHSCHHCHQPHHYWKNHHQHHHHIHLISKLGQLKNSISIENCFSKKYSESFKSFKIFLKDWSQIVFADAAFVKNIDHWMEFFIFKLTDALDAFQSNSSGFPEKKIQKVSYLPNIWIYWY